MGNEYSAMMLPIPSHESSNTSAVDDEKLPDGWKKKQSKTTGKCYYEHKATKKTQWHPPGTEDPDKDTRAQKEAEEESDVGKKEKRKQTEKDSHDKETEVT